MHILWGMGGMAVLLLMALALSNNRRAINLRTVGGALAIQVTFGALVLYVPPGRQALQAFTNAVQTIIDASGEGIDFLFGPILPEEGTVFAFQVLPVIVFFAALTSMLYYMGVLQWLVRLVGGAIHKLLGTSEPESIAATANIFVGQTEAPLVVEPYVERMTGSELFAVMVGGLTTVAGSVLVGYALLGVPLDYLLAAAFMAAPAGLVMAKIIFPQTEKPEPVSEKEISGRGDAEDANIIDALASGASNGLKLAANVGAMLLAFISVIALFNIGLGQLGALIGQPDITFELLLGYVFAPLAFVIGVPWEEALDAGSFIALKLILNEFVAFAQFGQVLDQYSEKSVAVITFALCGFANFGSLAILLGGLGGIAPSRRPDIARYGLRAVAGATLANLMNAAIAGIMIGPLV
jgi:concentrative nucleoside transporter, CNT family